MKPGNSIFSGLPTTVFTRMSALAAEFGAINLGQGFPDEDAPGAEDVLAAAAEALRAGPNQYPPMAGLADLRRAVAAHDRRFFGFDLDWESEVLVTSGATEALGDCLLGLIEPGDEVVLMEPLYDSYLPMVERAGGVAKLVRLAPPDWTLPEAELAAAFSERTKLIVLNTPHNPAGKVFGREELAVIAGLLEKHDAYAVCDEVYEHLVFDGARHLSLAALPGMAARCLRVGSAGKTFSLTGWKVGYVRGPAALLEPVVKAHQFNTFTTAPHLQAAVALGLGKDEFYFTGLAEGLAARRDRLAAGLRAVGFAVLPSAGTYFLTVDYRPLGFNGDDEAFCRQITTRAGVTAVPVSAFYRDGGSEGFVRFCFCKRPEVLDAAVSRLREWVARDA